MRRLFIISIVVFSIILASTVQAGGLFPKLYFVGLWQGVDNNDGSEAQRSITLNRDGTFNIIGQEPYTSGCKGERGMVTGTGVLEDGVIFSDDFTLTCFVVIEPPDPPGPFTVQTEYIPDKLNGTLIEQTICKTCDFEPTIFHKISNR